MMTYLALGDSYTIGESVSLHSNFPYQTVARLHYKGFKVADPVIVAVTGYTTDELAAAIRERKIQETFSFVSLLIGVNNQYRGRAIDNFREEFTGLLNQAIIFANGHPRHVFVLSIPDWGVTPFAEGRDHEKIAREIDEYNLACKTIAEVHKCKYLDITTSTRQNAQDRAYTAKDGLHPSEKEYAIWAEMLSEAVKETKI